MKIIIAGGTGFIGSPLLDELEKKQHEIVLLTKHPHAVSNLENKFITLQRWDRKTVGEWANHLNGADAIINLCGENIAGNKWTKEQKEKLLHSRLDSTRALVNAIKEAEPKPKTLINASAVGYYGNIEDEEIVDESHARGHGFLADVCESWESIANEAKQYNVRVVLLRIGIVIEKSGGALQKMLPPFQMFAGGPLGSGKQWVPWIHRDDVIGAILFALENENISGPVNVTAPNIVRNKDFCKALGKTIHRPSWAPVPSFAVKMLLGDMSEMVLTGQKAFPKKLKACGYKFKYENVEDALKAALEK
ncbi:MAG: TIGR01777 family protein [Candidatus Melainabacteria bacterium]|nr:TIGR01777 family protein [Candidatus Melainabacteria bacterium]